MSFWNGRKKFSPSKWCTVDDDAVCFKCCAAGRAYYYYYLLVGMSNGEPQSDVTRRTN